ncbi:MAG: type II toxin-antitoxin system RelE/ParE family toxin [Terracidiphilus sp.]
MKVLVRSAAREDILRQYSYFFIENDAERAAERFLASVQSEIESLSEHPTAGSPRFFDNPLLTGLRSWPVRGFPAIRIYYLHSVDELRIVRVLHGKRDVSPLLEDETDEG